MKPRPSLYDYEREMWWERFDIVTLLPYAATLLPAAAMLLGGAR